MVGDRRDAGIRARARATLRPPTATRACCGRRTSSSHGCSSTRGSIEAATRAARARVSRVAGARRALTARGALGSRVGRAVGGRWQLAAEHAARARDLSVQYGVERNQDYIPIAWVAAHRGQLELARAGVGASPEALRGADRVPSAPAPGGAGTRRALARRRGDGRRAARRGRPAGGGARLGCAAQRGRGRADYAEALLELGRIDEAVRVIDGWEADATRLGRERVLAHVTRCRGLVAAARGDGRRGSCRCSSTRSRSTTRSAMPSDGPARCSRSAWSSGAHGRSAPAREAIQAALGGFEQLGAATWVEKARAELGRIGGRTREEGLTAAERRVAVLVADGPDESGGRGRAVPRRADGRRPPDARLRQARRALAHRARAPAALTTPSARAKSGRSYLSSRARAGPSVERVPELPGRDLSLAWPGGRARLPRAAGTLGRGGAGEGGTPVRFDRSIYVPEDEICFFVFDAPSGRDARSPPSGRSSIRSASSRRSRRERSSHEATKVLANTAGGSDAPARACRALSASRWRPRPPG